MDEKIVKIILILINWRKLIFTDLIFDFNKSGLDLTNKNTRNTWNF